MQAGACARPSLPWVPTARGPHLAEALPAGLVAVGVEAFADRTVARPAHRVPPPASGARKVDSVGTSDSGWKVRNCPFWHQRDVGGLGPDWPRSGRPPPLSGPLPPAASTEGLSLSCARPNLQGPMLEAVYFSGLPTFPLPLEDAGDALTQPPASSMSAVHAAQHPHQDTWPRGRVTATPPPGWLSVARHHPTSVPFRLHKMKPCPTFTTLADGFPSARPPASTPPSHLFTQPAIIKY